MSVTKTREKEDALAAEFSPKREYSKQELSFFESFLDDFREERILTHFKPLAGQTVRIVNMEKAMEAYGAAKIYELPYHHYKVIIPKYQEFFEKYEQLNRLNERRAYAKRMELKELEASAAAGMAAPTMSEYE